MIPDSTLIATLDEYVKKTDEIIEILKDIGNDIRKLHNASKALKTGATVTSAAGTAVMVGAIGMAIFTGGASIVLATGIGAAVSLTGGVASIVTDLGDSYFSSRYLTKVENAIKEREEVENSLKSIFTDIQKDAVELSDQTEIISDEEDNEESFNIALLKRLIQDKQNYEIKRNEYLLKRSLNISRSLVANRKLIVNVSKNAVLARGIKSFGFRNGGLIWKSMRKSSVLVRNGMQKLGIQATRRSAMNLVKKGAIVLAVAFEIWDIVNLVQTFDKGHPAGEKVSEIIEILTNETSIFKEIHQAITSVEFNSQLDEITISNDDFVLVSNSDEILNDPLVKN